MYTECRHEGDIFFRFGDINELLLAEYHNPIPDSDYRNSMNRFLIDCRRQAGLEPRIPQELYRNHMAPEKVRELTRRNKKFLSA